MTEIPIQPNTLCQLCRGISLDQMRGPNCDKMQPHQPSYLALKRSAINGCVLCRFILVALGQSVSIDGQRGIEVLEHISDKYPGREISLVAWGGAGPNSFLDRVQIITSGEVPGTDTDGESLNGQDKTMHPDYGFALSGALDIFAYPDDPAAWHGGVTGRPLPSTDGSSESDFAFAEQCLSQCLGEHSGCYSEPDPALPARVLDLGPPDGFRAPYLLQTKGLRGRYVTLSHCWGGKVSATTRSDNIQQYKDTIPTTRLPLTFRHAIQIARRLGIQYLWIDSLCIIQDSRKDWEEESAKMGDIYKHSFLTIAARAASSSEGGCFIPRNQDIPTCQLKYQRSELSAEGTIYVRDPSFQIERLRETPLDSRGWVLQEKLLSPRILYYGAQQMYWECRHTSVRQDGKYYDVQEDGIRFAKFKQMLDVLAPFQTIFRGFYGPAQPDWEEKKRELAVRMGQWYNLVEEYSLRQLTFDTDKLPAIAGIAKEFAKYTSSSYVAGLWREDILVGLLWYRKGDMYDSPISKTLPSWSWARFSGQVSFWAATSAGLRVPDDSCECLGLSFQQSDALGDYDEVHDAKIQIRGRMLPVHCRILNSPLPYEPPRSYLYDQGGVQVGEARFDMLDSVTPTDELFVLLIYAGGGDRRQQPVGLVLSRTREDGTFNRKGYVWLEFKSSVLIQRGDSRDLFQDVVPRTFYLV